MNMHEFIDQTAFLNLFFKIALFTKSKQIKAQFNGIYFLALKRRPSRQQVHFHEEHFIVVVRVGVGDGRRHRIYILPLPSLRILWYSSFSITQNRLTHLELELEASRIAIVRARWQHFMGNTSGPPKCNMSIKAFIHNYAKVTSTMGTYVYI